jgi:hypothetical protein
VSTRVCGRTKSVLVLTATLLAVAPASTDDSAKPEIDAVHPPSIASPPSAAEIDTIQVPSGGRPLIVTRVEAIPRPLKAAIERADCIGTDSLVAKYPVLIFRPADGRRVMAVSPCFGITLDSRAFLFERSVEQEPTVMTFPVVALTGGISASSRPGLMTWEPQTMTLTAWRGSDTCPARELRHVYRQGGGDLNGFALSRIEQRQLRCATPEADWQMLWQSPAWKLEP